MEPSTFIIRFDGVSAAESNKYAASLRDRLLEACPGIEVERRRDEPSAQDFGGTLAVVLGTPFVVALASALKAWVTRTNASSLQVWTSQGMLVATNLDSKDVPTIVRELQSKATK